MPDPLIPVSAPAGTETATINDAVDTWMRSPASHDDAAVLAYSYVLAWALGKGEGLPDPSSDLTLLIDTVLRIRKTEVRTSFRAVSETLLTSLESNGVGMWVPFETPIKS